MTNITEALIAASKTLKESEIPNHQMEARSLLSIALKKDKTFLIAHNEHQLSAAEKEIFHNYVARRARREPFQHIVGFQEFYGIDFAVSPEVLIPRPETELIVEAGIQFLQNKTNPRFCEIGVGSGCIAVSILKNVEGAEAIAVDISGGALKVAQRNAAKHDVEKRLRLLHANLFDGLDDKEFDLIVSNPPYIRQDEFDELQKEVRDFDPRIALTDEKDGLSIIEKIAIEAPEHLKKEGLLLIEIGIDQAEAVKQFFSLDIWQSVEFIQDLQGIPRMLRAKKL